MKTRKAWALVRDGQIVSVRLYRREILALLNSCRIPWSCIRQSGWEIERVRICPLAAEEAGS